MDMTPGLVKALTVLSGDRYVIAFNDGVLWARPMGYCLILRFSEDRYRMKGIATTAKPFTEESFERLKAKSTQVVLNDEGPELHLSKKRIPRIPMKKVIVNVIEGNVADYVDISHIDESLVQLQLGQQSSVYGCVWKFAYNIESETKTHLMDEIFSAMADFTSSSNRLNRIDGYKQSFQ